MSIDIIKTFIKKLATQGHSFSEKIRSLKATYYRSALDLIDAYRGDAEMNGLKFDSHSEEKAVELFSKNIIKLANFYLNPMDAPFIPTWSRVKRYPRFFIKIEKAVNEDNRFIFKNFKSFVSTNFTTRTLFEVSLLTFCIIINRIVLSYIKFLTLMYF